MSNANIGWLFNKKMFFDYPNKIKTEAENILKAKKTNFPFKKGSHSSIKLKTIYPGLVVGSGYPHSMKGQSDNFDFGFYFDYTTGMPVIPGSTAKGMLRSYFGQNKNEKHKEQKENLIKSFLKDIGIENAEEVNIEKLQKEIFEGQSYNDETGKYEQVSMYQRDIFYDAFILSGYSENGVNNLLFVDDSITPHSKDGLGEPTPNRMLKIAPDVVWQFSFDLKDGIITAEQKEELFLLILQWGGIGAKTNVGYGQFAEWDNEKFQKFKEDQENKKQKRAIENGSDFEKIIYKVQQYKSINEDMKKYILANISNIEDKIKIVEIVESKVKRDEQGKYIGKVKFYNKIMEVLKE